MFWPVIFRIPLFIKIITVIFRGMAKNVVEIAINEALAEEDPIKGESKRLKARALQKGLADLFNAVEVAKSFEQYSGDDGFDLDPQVVQQMTELEL